MKKYALAIFAGLIFVMFMVIIIISTTGNTGPARTAPLSPEVQDGGMVPVVGPNDDWETHDFHPIENHMDGAPAPVEATEVPELTSIVISVEDTTPALENFHNVMEISVSRGIEGLPYADSEGQSWALTTGSALFRKAPGDERSFAEANFRDNVNTISIGTTWVDIVDGVLQDPTAVVELLKTDLINLNRSYIADWDFDIQYIGNGLIEVTHIWANDIDILNYHGDLQLRADGAVVINN